MNSRLFNAIGIDPGVVLIIFMILVIALLIVTVYLITKYDKLYKRYDIFMRGRDADSLEELLAELCERIDGIQSQDSVNKDIMRIINRNLVNSFQKMGLVKYNAFEGMGGQSSFALALLDMNDSGFILNVIHSQTSCYMYIKTIKEGLSDSLLGDEEKKALRQAVRKKDKAYEKQQRETENE